VYLDWGERLTSEGARPENPFYREWIEIHTAATLGPFVSFLTCVVDGAPESLSAGIAGAFEKALRYEVGFWDMAYEEEPVV
jgi:thiaminase